MVSIKQSSPSSSHTGTVFAKRRDLIGMTISMIIILSEIHNNRFLGTGHRPYLLKIGWLIQIYWCTGMVGGGRGVGRDS